MRRALRFVFIVPLTITLACNLITSGRSTDETVAEATPALPKPSQPSATTTTVDLLQATLQSTLNLPTLPATCPENNDKLLFASEMNPQGAAPVNFEIFVAGPDGSGIKRLTDYMKWNGNPSWSPERCRVAFSATTDSQSNEDIYIVNVDGSGLYRLTSDPADEREPAWSPDGSQIVFMREQEGNRDIYMINADGTSLRQLTDHPAQDEDPEWSPKSDEIIFSSRRDGNWEIYRIKSDGNDLTRLTKDKLQDTHPTWSPDGDRIAFLSNRSAYVEAYIMDKEGIILRQVTFQSGNVPTVDMELNWSQNGAWLGFTCTIPGKDGGGMQAICAVGEDGGEVWIEANRDPSRSHEPDW
jgi:Tol biopolymer transport system component